MKCLSQSLRVHRGCTPRCPSSTHTVRTSSLPQSSYGLPQRPRQAEPVYYPAAEEEEAISHTAFMQAYESAKPLKLKVDKLQEFCAALVQRRRSIPSTGGGDALMHMFMEIDLNNDGQLAAEEIAQAFQSHGVKISPTQLQELMDEFQGTEGCNMTKEDWPDFVLALAVADLHVREHQSSGSSSSSGSSLDSM